MKISIIIPVYKVEDYLRECVDSVLRQTYIDIEVILVDDGSPDGSPAICDEYALKDPRVNVIHKPNGGLSDARNCGTDAASGEYVVYLDSDDWWIGENTLEEVCDLLKLKPDVLFFDRITYCSNGTVIEPKTMPLSEINGLSRKYAMKKLITNGVFAPSACNKFVRRDLIKKGNVYFKKGLVCEDIDWTFRMMPFVQKLMGYRKPFYGYRRREGSITATVGKKNICDLLSIIEYWSNALNITESDPEVRYQLLGFLNYQLFIANGYTAGLCTEDAKELGPRLDALSWLSKYTVDKKTKLAKVLTSVLGMKGSRKLLHFYISIKDKGFKIQ